MTGAKEDWREFYKMEGQSIPIGGGLLSLYGFYQVMR